MGLGSYLFTIVPMAFSFIALILLVLSTWLAWPWTAHAFRQIMIRRAMVHIEHKGAQILYNLMLPDRQGGSIWIDYLVVTQYGISAIQMLACSGRVYGSPHDATWVQERGNSRFRFPNPLRQSDQTARVINNILGQFEVREALVYSGCTLNDSMPENVLRSGDIESFLLQKSDKKLSSSRRSWVVNTLTQLAIQDDQLMQQHVKDAMERQGSVSHLTWGKQMLLGSCGLMVLAVGMVAYHLLNR